MTTPLPETGTLVRLNGGMPGTRPGQIATLHRQGPTGLDQTTSGLVWLEIPVAWSHGLADGYWAGAGEYEVLTVCPICGRELEYILERALCQPEARAIENHYCPKEQP